MLELIVFGYYACLSCTISHSRLSLCLQLKELNHDNIKPFVGACVEPGHICYLMQCCIRGTVQVSMHIKLHVVNPPVVVIENINYGLNLKYAVDAYGNITFNYLLT